MLQVSLRRLVKILVNGSVQAGQNPTTKHPTSKNEAWY
jgi:hypothetical protein